MEPTGGSSTRFDANLEADSTTSFLCQRPLAATSRASRDVGEGFRQQPLPNSAENWRALFLGGQTQWRKLVFWASPGLEGRGISGLCGLRAAGEHLSERTMMRVESSTSENTSMTLPYLAERMRTTHCHVPELRSTLVLFSRAIVLSSPLVGS